MKRLLVLLYGVACYAVFLAVFLYSIGFIGNFVVPKAMDSPRDVSLGTALAVDLGLLALFALQHSVMARPAFKRWWTKVVPAEAERSTYVLFSSLALIALFWHWQPLGGGIWSVKSTVGVAMVYTAYAMGWALLLYSTFLINHFDLFGLRQVWLYATGRSYSQLQFKTPWLYQQVRHPLYVGWLMIFWATPEMTMSHLLFAVMTTAYILLAIQFEERDLIDAHPEYAAYRQRVPMLLPLRRKAKAFSKAATARSSGDGSAAGHRA
jgi:protein-S-isoprenylcysteine O-methyltransferase Ste14